MGAGHGDLCGLKGHVYMLNIILRSILPEVLFLLQGTIKNPQSLANEISIITEIRDILNVIIMANTPPPTVATGTSSTVVTIV